MMAFIFTSARSGAFGSLGMRPWFRLGELLYSRGLRGGLGCSTEQSTPGTVLDFFLFSQPCALVTFWSGERDEPYAAILAQAA